MLSEHATQELSSDLINAIDRGDTNTVKFLLLSGADPDGLATDTYSPLAHVVLANNKLSNRFGCNMFLSKTLEIAELLIKKGADINASKQEPFSIPLVIASEEHDDDFVRFLVKAGANVNVAGRHGWTPLMNYSGRGDLPMIKFLVRYGANINQEKHDKWTPLALATYNGYPKIVRFLVARGADISHKVKVGDGASNALELLLNHIYRSTEYKEIISFLQKVMKKKDN